jgi:carboxylesterase type B
MNDVIAIKGGHPRSKEFAVVERELPPSSALIPSLEDDRTTIKTNNLSIEGYINQATGVAVFQNLAYARIAARWHEAKLIDPRAEHGVVNASSFGPCCPQPYDVVHDQTAHLYPKVIDIRGASEFNCLSLNIYAPPSAPGSSQRLPVFVWIHGGAFTYGDASDEYGELHPAI